MGKTAQNNLKIFKELCGDKGLGNARIVTTYWNHIDEKDGAIREAALKGGPFKPLIDAGAKLYRHDNKVESARSILSELIQKAPVKPKIIEELNAGKALGDTSAGAVIIEEMKELEQQYEKEMAELNREIEEATKTKDEQLRAEVAEERRKLEEEIARAKEDRKKLETIRTTRSKPVEELDASTTHSPSMIMHRVTQEETGLLLRKWNSDREGLNGVQRLTTSSLHEELQEPRKTWRNFFFCC